MVNHITPAPESLTSHFNSVKTPTKESLETTRNKFCVMAKMRGVDNTTVAGIRVNQSGRTDNAGAIG